MRSKPVAKNLYLLAAKGDIEAFELLMERFYKPVYILAVKSVGNEHDAAKLAQEVFVRVFRKLKNTNESKLPILVLETAGEVLNPKIKLRNDVGMAVIGRVT